MKVGVPKETYPGETRVALVPDVVKTLSTKGVSCLVQQGAGLAAGYPDLEYSAAGATLVPSRQAVLSEADLFVTLRAPMSEDLPLLREGQAIIGTLWPLQEANQPLLKQLAERKVTVLSMDLVPRISRAQSMDVLSSQSNIAGYKAVVLAAADLPKLFPLLMTAAGTIQPAKVFVLGAGVAGLQAIATAKRLGAIVYGYDVRPVVKEQVESLGATFVEIAIEAKDAQDSGGYAKAVSEETQRRQAELLSKTIAESDVVITTALVPGKKAPVLVPAEAVARMRPGSVVVDLAAESGGNCPLTEAGKTVIKHGVTIHGHTNLPATVAFHASQMYARNIAALLQLLLKEGAWALDTSDEIVRDTLATHQGEFVSPRVRQALGLPELKMPEPPKKAEGTTAPKDATAPTQGKGKKQR